MWVNHQLLNAVRPYLLVAALVSTAMAAATILRGHLYDID